MGQLTELEAEVARLAAIVAGVLDEHQRTGNVPECYCCKQPWPCATVRICGG